MIDVHLALNAAVAAVAMWAAVTDVRERRIPNWCVGATAVLAMASALAAGGPALAAMSLAVGAAALAGAIAVYALGMVGAGDAKLFAALAIWAGAEGLPAFMASLAVATLVLSAWSMATRRGRAAVGAGGLAALPKRQTLPVGLALAAAAVATAAL